MMLTIHGLPPKSKYQDVKLLIKQECKISDFILDLLVSESDGLKKIRVGVANDNVGYKLTKCLNGFRMPGNFILKVEPLGKTAPGPINPVQGGYDSRDYQPQRNDYQSNVDYINQSRPNEYNRGGPTGPSGMRGPSGPQGPSGYPSGPGGPHNSNKPYLQGPVDNIRPSPWSNENTSSQWNPNSSMSTQVQQKSFNYQPTQQNNQTPASITQHSNRDQAPRTDFRSYDQGRQGQSSGPNYGGYPPKGNIPPNEMHSRQNLRNIPATGGGNETSASTHGGRYPSNQQYHQEKPVTIMKDNFQGPTQFNITHPEGHKSTYSQQPNPSPWQSGNQAQQTKPQFNKSIPYEKTYDDRNYTPMNQAREPKNMQSRPDTSKEFDKRRGFSPPQRRDDLSGRRISPSRGKEAIDHRGLPARMGDMGKRMLSPTGRLDDLSQRQMSPGRMRDVMHRRVSPQTLRDDPHGRKYSPPNRRASPGDRRNISGMRHESPPRRISPRRMSPSRRLLSPSRRDESRSARYSPDRHLPDKMTVNKYEDSKDLKPVLRPAYDSTSSRAQNQVYSDDYRANIRDAAQYSTSGTRHDQIAQWERYRDERTMKKQEQDRMDERLPLGRGRLIENIEKRYSPTRKSRSPVRRDRSPIRDRYKRNSRSPRSSHSPRRSWALEKRRSPDAPPPPVWPGQNEDHPRHHRPNFSEKDDKPVHRPVWEGRSFKEGESRNRRNDEQKQYEDAKNRIAKDLERHPQDSNNEHKYQRESKFSQREEYDERRDNYRQRDSPNRKNSRDDLPQRPREDDRPDNYNRRQSPYRDVRRENIHTKVFDKEFDDIYNRALQFKKKAEELRRSSSKKNDMYEDNRGQREKEREDRLHYEDRSKYREEESQRLNEREERRENIMREEVQNDIPRDDRLRNDKMQNDRSYHHDGRGGYQAHDTQQQPKHPIDDNKTNRTLANSSSSSKQKRDKAVNEIAGKIIERSDKYKQLLGPQRQRLLDELKLVVTRILYDMFGNADVSFIEMVIKYQAKYNLKDEAKILLDVVESLQKPSSAIKRHNTEPLEQPAKISRNTPSSDPNPELAARACLGDSNFNVNLGAPNIVAVPGMGLHQSQAIINQPMIPMMVSAPFYQTYDNLQQNSMYIPEPVPPVADMSQLNSLPAMAGFSEAVEPLEFQEEDGRDGYRLYLFKDDLERITNIEADLLKDFIVSQMINITTEQFQGWAPDFTLKGLQTKYRYEVVAKDEGTKMWLLNLDFSDFEYFHVLVYTKEELWYERAAIWLPGHSRVRNIEPLEKLKLQNKNLSGVNLNKWKFVKKIINNKGTRLYVDMPPSSARGLELHEMKLSYELQQVSVFLKAVAVDKDSFDAGLKEVSLTSSAEIIDAVQNAPMPSLTNDPSLVKIVLKGSKTLRPTEARKIKEIVIYQLFKYHQQGGLSRTDFLKYGFVQPKYLAIMPLNQESKDWLMGCSFGKVNRQSVVVLGGEEDNTRFIKMHTFIPLDDLPSNANLRPHNVIEILKHNNQGIKGINFSLWKPIAIKPLEKKRARVEVEIDLDSVETLFKMRFQLDYKQWNCKLISVHFSSDYSESGLAELVKKYKHEMTDSYDVANMDIESGYSDPESSDVVCLD